MLPLIAGGLVTWTQGYLPTAEAKAAEPATWKTYQDKALGIEFSYHAEYVLKELRTPDGRLISILGREARAPATDWLFDISVDEMSRYPRAEFDPPRTSVLRFATAIARLHCDADGPDESVSCPEVARQAPFATSHGLKGYELYLTEVTESFSSGKKTGVSRRIKGPIYALDISSRRSVIVLLMTLTERAEASARHRETLKEIVRTMSMSRRSR